MKEKRLLVARVERVTARQGLLSGKAVQQPHAPNSALLAFILGEVGVTL